jgi:hypothetical protein
MVKSKKMNEELFARLHKELTTTGELIRARQEEKQGLLDEFTAESKRFFFGKISERSLAASVKKTNAELKRLDKGIRAAMSRSRVLADKIKSLVAKQAPIGYRATLSGINGGKVKAKKKVVKKKKKAKKKAKKKVVKKKKKAKKKKKR